MHSILTVASIASFRERGPITHLSFMDDLKAYEESMTELEATVQRAESVSEAVGMKFGLRKCAVAHEGRKGEIGGGGGVDTARDTIAEPQKGNIYKYLGVEQVVVAEHTKTRKRVEKEYFETYETDVGVGSEEQIQGKHTQCVGRRSAEVLLQDHQLIKEGTEEGECRPLV